MAGIKPPELYEFYLKLHARGESTQSLGIKVGRSHSIVSRVLNGGRRRGPVWSKLAALLTEEEKQLLDVAQSSTWNTKRIANRPQWTPAKQAALQVA
jgi:hypothetical protein